MSRLPGPRLGPRGTSSGRGILIVLVCASVILLALYTYEGTSGPVHTLRSAAHVVTTPFSWAGSQVARPFAIFYRAVTNAGASDEVLSELEAENATLTAQVAELEEYRVENERLRKMLDVSGSYGLMGVGARVIGTSTDDWSDTLTVDKGSDSGIAVGMAVTDGANVVGQVTEVSSSSATVTLISDSSSQVGALLQGSRATGVLRGSVDGSLHLEYVSTSSDVSVGEIVVTSGLGGVYPKGLLLGTVASVTSSPSDVYYSIVVTPVSTAANYEEVYIVVSYDDAAAVQEAEAVLAAGGYVYEGQAVDAVQDGSDTADQAAVDGSDADGAQAAVDDGAQDGGEA